MSFFCKHCGVEIDAPYEWGGMAVCCPSCSRLEPLQYRNGQRIAISASGYGVSFGDFVQLLNSKEAHSLICAMLSCSVKEHGNAFVLVSERGSFISNEYAHLTIQAHSVNQRQLYNLAMSLWR